MDCFLRDVSYIYTGKSGFKLDDRDYITQYIVFMAKILSKKLLIVMNVCAIIGTGKVFYIIDDFQRGKTFEGWGEIFSMLLMVGVAVYVNVKYFKEKDKE
jgi:hypothetical protein